MAAEGGVYGDIQMGIITAIKESGREALFWSKVLDKEVPFTISEAHKEIVKMGCWVFIPTGELLSNSVTHIDPAVEHPPTHPFITTNAASSQKGLRVHTLIVFPPHKGMKCARYAYSDDVGWICVLHRSEICVSDGTPLQSDFAYKGIVFKPARVHTQMPTLWILTPACPLEPANSDEGIALQSHAPWNCQNTEEEEVGVRSEANYDGEMPKAQGEHNKDNPPSRGGRGDSWEEDAEDAEDKTVMAEDQSHSIGEENPHPSDSEEGFLEISHSDGEGDSEVEGGSKIPELDSDEGTIIAEEDYEEGNSSIPKKDYEEESSSIPKENYEEESSSIPKEDYEEESSSIPKNNFEEGTATVTQDGSIGESLKNAGVMDFAVMMKVVASLLEVPSIRESGLAMFPMEMNIIEKYLRKKKLNKNPNSQV